MAKKRVIKGMVNLVEECPISAKEDNTITFYICRDECIYHLDFNGSHVDCDYEREV